MSGIATKRANSQTTSHVGTGARLLRVWTQAQPRAQVQTPAQARPELHSVKSDPALSKREAELVKALVGLSNLSRDAEDRLREILETPAA